MSMGMRKPSKVSALTAIKTRHEGEIEADGHYPIGTNQAESRGKEKTPVGRATAPLHLLA